MTSTDYAIRSSRAGRFSIPAPALTFGADRKSQDSHGDAHTTVHAIASLELSRNVPSRRSRIENDGLQNVNQWLDSYSRKGLLLSPMIAGAASIAAVATGLLTEAQAVMFLVGSWSGHLLGFMSLFQQIKIADCKTTAQ